MSRAPYTGRPCRLHRPAGTLAGQTTDACTHLPRPSPGTVAHYRAPRPLPPSRRERALAARRD